MSHSTNFIKKFREAISLSEKKYKFPRTIKAIYNSSNAFNFPYLDYMRFPSKSINKINIEHEIKAESRSRQIYPGSSDLFMR